MTSFLSIYSKTMYKFSCGIALVDPITKNCVKNIYTVLSDATTTRKYNWKQLKWKITVPSKYSKIYVLNRRFFLTLHSKRKSSKNTFYWFFVSIISYRAFVGLYFLPWTAHNTVIYKLYIALHARRRWRFYKARSKRWRKFTGEKLKNKWEEKKRIRINK